MKMEYIFIKQKDEYYASKEMFRNFLCGNKRIEFKDVADDKRDMIIFDEKILEYGLESVEVEKSNEIIFYLVVEVQGDEDNQAVTLETFDSLIKEINEKNGMQFTINTVWNDISAHYGKKLYPDISKVESMLRKIIYLFMLKTVGSKWIEIGTPEKFQTSVDSVIKKNNKEKTDINAEWLTYADFITLGYFFTAPYSLKTDLKPLFEELKQYGEVEILNNGGNQTDAKIEANRKRLTGDVIRRLSDEYEPKNNWERYFSDKLSIKGTAKFSKDWSSLYNIRNNVAHGKPIDKASFEKANELIEMFTMVFDECIRIIDTLEMTVEEAEAVEAVAQQVIQNEQLEVCEGRRKSVGIMPYGINFNSGALLENWKIMGDTIRTADLSSISDSATNVANALSRLSCNLPDVASIGSVTQRLSALAERNALIADNERILRGAEHITEAFSSMLSQINSFPRLGDSLQVERITAALDRPIVIDYQIPKIKLNENINFAPSSKADVSDDEPDELKTETGNSEDCGNNQG